MQIVAAALLYAPPSSPMGAVNNERESLVKNEDR